MTHQKVTCESQLRINFHKYSDKITSVRDFCKSHVRGTLKSQQVSDLKVATVYARI